MLAQQIVAESKVDMKKRSPLNEYLVLTTNFKVEDSSMEKEVESKAIEFAKSNETQNMNFIRVDSDQRIVIISYKLQSNYTNDCLNKHFI